MNATFRLRKGILIQGLVCAAIFLLAVAGHASLLFVENAKQLGFKDNQSATFMGWFGIVVYGSMLLLSCYTIAAYYIETFSVDETTILIRSVTQNRRFDASSLKSVLWNHKWHSGKLTFRTATTKSVLHLSGFESPDRLEIIRIVHRLTPQDVQVGWDEFCHFVALPMRDGKPTRQPGSARIDPALLPESARVHLTRGRIDRFFVALLFITVLVAVALWQLLALPNAIALPAMVLFLWGLLRWSIPKTGAPTIKWSATRETKSLVIAFLIVPLMFVGLLFKAVGWDGMIAMWGGLAFMGILTVDVVRHGRRREKEQRARDAEQIPLSLERWNLAEATLSGPAGQLKEF